MQELWTSAETAEYLRITENTLRRYRQQGRGPKFVRLGGPGGHIRYRPSDVADYIEAKSVEATG